MNYSYLPNTDNNESYEEILENLNKSTNSRTKFTDKICLLINYISLIITLIFLFIFGKTPFTAEITFFPCKAFLSKEAKETSIWIDPDNEAPVFTFVPAGDYGDCDNFPPVFGVPVVEDACGSVTLTFIDLKPK